MTATATLARAPVRRVFAPCGVEAWLVEDRSLPMLVTTFAFRGAGAAQDPGDRLGLASVLASLLDEGAGGLDSSAFQERLDELAVDLSFSAETDRVSGWLRTLTRHREAAFDLLGSALAEPRFDPEPVARVRGLYQASLRTRESDPDHLASRALWSAAFPGHPYGRSSEGTPETLEALDAADLRAARSRVFARDNLLVVAVGDVGEAELGALLDRAFGALPATATLAEVSEAAPGALGERRLIDLDVPQTSIRFLRPGLARADPDYLAADLVNHVLGGGSFTSRLFQDVREARGLAYSVWSGNRPLARASAFMAGTSTKNERAAESVQVIRDHVARMAAEGPGGEELAKAKSYFLGSFPLRLDSSVKIARELLNLRLHDLAPSYLEERAGLIAAVTPADALRAAGRLLGDGSMLVAMAGRPVGV